MSVDILDKSPWNADKYLGATRVARVRSCVIGSKWGLALVFALAWRASAAQAAETSPLTTIAAVRALSHEDAARHLPVDIQATHPEVREGFEAYLRECMAELMPAPVAQQIEQAELTALE